MIPRRGRSPLRILLPACAACAALFCHSSFGPSAFCHGFGRLSWAQATPRSQGLTLLNAEAAEAADVMEVPVLEEAPVYMTEVDVLSGELDTSALPEEMGVYAIFDSDGRMQYIGLSRQIKQSVAKHAKAIGIQEVADLIATVKVAEMPGQSKDLLKKTWESWIKEHMAKGGEIPVGNLPEDAPGADPRWRGKGAQTKPPLSLGGVGGTQIEALDAVRRAVGEYPVILFMKGTPAMPQCGFSARTSGLLREIGMPFETVDVLDDDSNPGVRDAVKEFGNWPTIPQLYVGGQLVGGADIVMEMHQTGTLEKTLKDAVEGKTSDGSQGEQQSASVAFAGGKVTLINDPGRPTATALCKALDANFQLMDLRVVDDSAAHEGDAGALEMGLTGESHFSVEMVAPDFEGLLPVQRQQKVYQALSDVMPRIHALSLVTRTPAEANDDAQ